MVKQPKREINIKITPPAVARRYRVSADKVQYWIRTGELRAVNIATNPEGRPRYVVDEMDLLAFERRREARPRTASSRISRKRSDPHVIEFF